MKKLNVALVGLGFGLEFVAIYCKHPDIDKVYVVDKNEKLLNIAKERYSIPDERCFTDLQDVLDIPEIDAVHLVTPPATHAPFSVRVLNAGKHCGCTIPMGMSIQELNDIIAARKASGKNYMFMETTIFQREFLYIQELYKKGELGRLQYMTCAHYQDMEGWPEYWEGFPPLMHPTHAVAPCLMLAGHLPDKVYARGSGKIRKELADKYGWEYFDKLKANGLRVEEGNSAIQNKLLTGEYAAVMILEENILKLANTKKEPLKIVYPTDGVINVPSPIAIFKETKNPEGAKALVDWWLSKEGQEAVVKGWMHSVRGDVKAPTGAEETKKIVEGRIKVDWQKLANNNAQIKEEFRKRVMDK